MGHLVPILTHDSKNFCFLSYKSHSFLSFQLLFLFLSFLIHSLLNFLKKMQVKTFANHFVSSPNSRLKLLSQSLTSCSKTFLISTTLQWHSSLLPSGLCVFAPKDHRKRFITTCISSSQEFASENDISNTSVSLSEEKEEEKAVEVKTEGLADQSIWNQIKEIMKFTGPATGLWICGPLMSLIDTAVIGQGSSLELAALGTSSRSFLIVIFCLVAGKT